MQGHDLATGIPFDRVPDAVARLEAGDPGWRVADVVDNRFMIKRYADQGASSGCILEFQFVPVGQNLRTQASSLVIGICRDKAQACRVVLYVYPRVPTLSSSTWPSAS